MLLESNILFIKSIIVFSLKYFSLSRMVEHTCSLCILAKRDLCGLLVFRFTGNAYLKLSMHLN